MERLVGSFRAARRGARRPAVDVTHLVAQAIHDGTIYGRANGAELDADEVPGSTLREVLAPMHDYPRASARLRLRFGPQLRRLPSRRPCHTLWRPLSRSECDASTLEGPHAPTPIQGEERCLEAFRA